MLFLEALEELKAGEAMRREAWDFKEGYLKILPDMNHVWKIVTDPNPNAGNFIFSVEDFDSNDWVKYEKPASPVFDVIAEARDAA
jgi:hypothetical protein